MRVYGEIARRSFRRYATYRRATVAGLFTNTVFGFMRSYILILVVQTGAGAGGAIGGYDAKDAVTFTWLGQGLLMAVCVFQWDEVALRFRTGDIATDLTKPYDFQGFWLAHDYGRAAYHTLFRGVVPWITGALFFTLRAPEHPATLALFVASLALGVTVSFGYRFILNVICFWAHDSGGVLALGMVFTLFFCGLTIPIPFFPGWLQGVARATPWAAMMQTPIDVFLEQRGASALVLQGLWAVVLLGVGRWLLQRARVRLVVQGG